MDLMEDLDQSQLTLIIENMAGRNESLKDGGTYVFSRFPDLVSRMNQIMEKLILKAEKNERSATAISRYRKAYDKWT